ncbi:hypothetical protein DT385_19725 [Pseudomonas syringae]|nr:hypothetical protein DT385_19725 [Pseudomonas syringae]
MNSLNTSKKALVVVDLEVPVITRSVENLAASNYAIQGQNPSFGTHSEHVVDLNAELAIDLDATANPDQNSRLFWDENVFVCLELSSTDCSYLLNNFAPEVQESFKRAILQYRADGQIGLSKLIGMLSTLRTAAK